MRVLVCGGRNYNDQGRIFRELDACDEVETIDLIIEGGARGADGHGRAWALSKSLPCMTIHACWDRLGRSAGMIRNEWMIKYGQPDLVLAFPGGSGTEGMKKIALRHNVKVRSAK